MTDRTRNRSSDTPGASPATSPGVGSLTPEDDALRGEDAALIAGVRAGDHAAVERLHGRYASALEAFVRRQAGGHAHAQEVVQEVFLTVWRDAQRYDPARGSVGAWLFTLARNKAIDLLRRETVERRHRAEVDLERRVAPHDVHHTAWMRIRRDRVREAVRTLPEAQRTALELAFFGGLTHVEVAERLDIPLGTAKTRIRSGLLRLRATLGDLLVDPLLDGARSSAPA